MFSPRRALRGLLVAALATAAVAWGGSSQESTAPVVAVLDFNGFLMGEGANSAPLGKAVAAMLVTEFSSRPDLRVVERRDLQAVIDEQKLSLSGLVDEDQAIEIGKLVGASYMISGQVSGVMGTLRMDVHVFDSETSEILMTEKMTGKTEDLLDIVVRIADQFADRLDLPGSPQRPEPEAVPAMATIEFSRAVDFEDKGDTEQALEHYRRALEIHPTHQGALRAVERLEGGGDA